jgi:hypothetical protein
MTDDRQHPGISFAQAYATGAAQHHFNAATAIGHLSSLIEDIRSLARAADLAERHELPDAPWGGWQSAQAFSYYSVGTVTCLEWHARSRLSDLLTFRPTSIDPDDLKPLANPRVMTQMISHDVSAAQLVGGMMSVGSANKYLAVFQRIYKALGIETTPYEIVDRIPNPIPQPRPQSAIELLGEIFGYRNDLVHEIGPSVAGAYVNRYHLTAHQAEIWADFSLSCMKALELPITQHADRQFPNMLDQEGKSTTEEERLDAYIIELENLVTERVKEAGRGEEEWETALKASRSAMEAGSSYVGFGLYVRVYPNTLLPGLTLRTGRIAHLKAILESLRWFV